MRQLEIPCIVRRIAAVAFATAVAICLVAAAQCGLNRNVAATPAPTGGNPCPLSPISVSSRIPHDAATTSQAYFDCFAWQEFIGANWDADPRHAGAPDPSVSPSAFGRPMDFAPPVFETYADALDVFLPGAEPPHPWGSVDPSQCAVQHMAAGPGRRLLRMSSIVAPGFQGMSGVNQAFPGTGPGWLADRDGTIVWYQILMNRDEYDYIARKQYYNADKQLQAITSDQRIDLPEGIPGGTLGAIEIKAAWLPVADSQRQKRYRMQNAVVLDENGRCHTVAVGLIALHIIHKTESQPTWVWSTFEQVDNAPDAGATPSSQFVFYRPSCQPSPIPASCMLGKNGAQTSCTSNTPPAYMPDSYFAKGATCPVYPIQVVHDNPMDPAVASINIYAQSLVRAANPRSVYQYYRLVNVLWSSNSTDPNAGASAPVAPVIVYGLTPPGSQPVANAVTETYVQNMTCLSCHARAKIAKAQDAPPEWKPYFSDFSFLMAQAHTPFPTAEPR